MLIDEIEDTKKKIKSLGDILESSYSKLLVRFPEEAKLIEALSRKVTLGSRAHDRRPRHGSSNNEIVPVSRVVDLTEERESRLHELQELKEALEAQEVEEHKPKDPRSLDGMPLRKIFSKINQLCHPDKCRSFDRSITVRLTEQYYDAQTAYQGQVRETLVYIYAKVCLLRGEPHRLAPDIVNDLNMELNYLLYEIRQMQGTLLYKAITFYRAGHQSHGDSMFRNFLMQQINKLKETLNNGA